MVEQALVASGDRVPGRNGALDSLRGIAALTVLLFHYTSRFQTIYPSEHAPVLSLRWAGNGVIVFFVLSGYVISMTLERTTRAMDFVVSRVTRIFPAYWLAVALTFVTVRLLGLPGREVSGSQALVNLTMLQTFLRTPDVDGVYWTLQVELSFYVLMLVLFTLKLLRGRRLIGSLIAWLVVSQAIWMSLHHVPMYSYVLFFQTEGIQYAPMFVAGISLYAVRTKREPVATFWALIVMSLLIDLWRSGVESASFTAVAIVLVWCASHPRIARVNYRPLVFLGFISYPLYLIHQNIGYAILRHLHYSPTLNTAIVAGIVVLLATAISYLVEHPATRYLRARYRLWRQPPPGGRQRIRRPVSAQE